MIRLDDFSDNTDPGTAQAACSAIQILRSALAIIRNIDSTNLKFYFVLDAPKLPRQWLIFRLALTAIVTPGKGAGGSTLGHHGLLLQAVQSRGW